MIQIHVEAVPDSAIEVEQVSEITIEIPELSVEQFAFRASVSADEARGYRDQAEVHKVGAETARTGAEAARDAAEASSQGIDDVLVQTEAARDITEGFRDEAEFFRDQSQSARDDSFQHRLASEAARDDSQSARDQSFSARDDAQFARDNAQTAEAGAVTAQGLAEGAQIDAETARDAAQTARTGSEAARDLSQQYRNEADGFRGQAETARDDSQAARDLAEGYRDQAQSAKSEAELARDQAEDLFDQFGELYLGPHSEDPTTDNDGGPLQEGSIYFNTTDGTLKFYTGTEWISPDLSAAASASEAEQSATEAEAARDLAEGYRDDSLSAKNDAETARTGAETAQGAAETAQGASEGARDAALGYRNEAEQHRDDALSHRIFAEGARDTAEQHRDDAQFAKVAAEGARDTAEQHRDDAQSAQSAALQSEQNAQTSEDNAFASASAASTSEGNAATSESSASSSATAAQASETKAQEWAANPEDSEVELGLYSALHYAAKAGASAASAESEVSDHEAASNPHPQYATGGAQDTHSGRTDNPHGVTAAQVGLGNVDNTSDADKPVSSAQQAALDDKLDANDPSVTNAREWTASTVGQAEAEDGAATTRRAWTAQRVRQAIVSWWNGVTSSFGRTFVNLADAAAARSELGLGSAATKADIRYAHRSNDLSDLSNAGTARSNLGLGSAATQNDSRYAHRGNNLSDLQSSGSARSNLGLGSAATMGTTSSRTSSSTITLLQAKGMNDHRSSGDHDGRYLRNVGGVISGDLSLQGPLKFSREGARFKEFDPLAPPFQNVEAAELQPIDLYDNRADGPTGNYASGLQWVPRNSHWHTQVLFDRNNRLFFRVSGYNSTSFPSWKEVYHQGSILGTVSRSGGVPTGAIIERSNGGTNGDYVRFADGTQICTNVMSSDSGSTTTWNFPATFSSSTIQVFGTGSGGPAITFMLITLNNSSVGFNMMDADNTRRSLTTRLMAIGRWY